MTKFTLIAEHTDLYGKPTGHKVTHEFDVDTLDSVLENTDLFLRGVGFMPSGTLDYISEEVQADIEHPGFYFDPEKDYLAEESYK